MINPLSKFLAVHFLSMNNKPIISALLLHHKSRDCYENSEITLWLQRNRNCFPVMDVQPRKLNRAVKRKNAIIKEILPSATIPMLMPSINIYYWCNSPGVLVSVLVGRTNGKQFYPGFPQAPCRRRHIVLWLPVGDEDSYLGNAGPGSRLRLEAVLQDEGQSQTWTDRTQWTQCDKDTVTINHYS